MQICVSFVIWKGMERPRKIASGFKVQSVLIELGLSRSRGKESSSHCWKTQGEGRESTKSERGREMLPFVFVVVSSYRSTNAFSVPHFLHLPSIYWSVFPLHFIFRLKILAIKWNLNFLSPSLLPSLYFSFIIFNSSKTSFDTKVLPARKPHRQIVLETRTLFSKSTQSTTTSTIDWKLIHMEEGGIKKVERKNKTGRDIWIGTRLAICLMVKWLILFAKSHSHFDWFVLQRNKQRIHYLLHSSKLVLFQETNEGT